MFDPPWHLAHRWQAQRRMPHRLQPPPQLGCSNHSVEAYLSLCVEMALGFGISLTCTRIKMHYGTNLLTVHWGRTASTTSASIA